VDVATGKNKIEEGYKTEGTPTSTYREGNTTIQFEVTPSNSTYNTASNVPDPEPTWAVPEIIAQRSMKREALYKPRKPRMSWGKRNPT
jgi:hypothetical protein